VGNSPLPTASGKRAGNHPAVFLAEGRHFQMGQVLVACLFLGKFYAEGGMSAKK